MAFRPTLVMSGVGALARELVLQHQAQLQQQRATRMTLQPLDYQSPAQHVTQPTGPSTAQPQQRP